jgi:uncharacterized membrane protein
VAKTLWTEADFDAMGWHDNAVRAVALEPVPDHPGRLVPQRLRVRILAGAILGIMITAQFHWIEHPSGDLFWLLGDALGHLRTRRSCDP